MGEVVQFRSDKPRKDRKRSGPVSARQMEVLHGCLEFELSDRPLPDYFDARTMQALLRHGLIAFTSGDGTAQHKPEYANRGWVITPLGRCIAEGRTPKWKTT